MPKQTRSTNRPIAGNPKADILIVGDCPDGWAIKDGKPFSSQAGSILQQCLHQAGLLTSQVCMTNFVYDQKDIKKIWREKGAKGPSQLKGDIKHYRESLHQFITEHSPKVIVAMGELTMYALTGESSINKIRGFPYKTPKENRLVIPTIHVKNTVRTNYLWRHYISHDLKKAKECAEELMWAPSIRISIPADLSQAVKMIRDMNVDGKRVAFDIEVSNFITSCIGFSDKAGTGCSIPVDDRWTIEEEITIWEELAKLLENPNVIKIAQNGIFDIHFLIYTMGIFTTGYKPDEPKLEDTMMSHSIMYPDFLKGLSFLASIYTKYPYWKDELEHKPIKKDD